jgi:purine-binding chemotaxis protein CheW
MNNNSYLIFSFNQLDYAIPTLTVQEIFLLPEITLIPESPPDIVGVINLRGVIVPIMDLNRRFGYSDQQYQLNDSVVIMNWENVRVGIIVNQVENIKTISTDEITGELSHDQYFEANAPERFISGFAQYLERIITILKVESILRYVDEQKLDSLETLTNESEEVISPKTAIFCAHLTDHEREILHNRADHLRQVNLKQELTSVQPLAVVKFSDEFFGVDLKLVREFTNITRVTPIPCTPPHIVGNLNLRGEILTLIDLSNFLQLNTALVNQRQKAMVV